MGYNTDVKNENVSNKMLTPLLISQIFLSVCTVLGSRKGEQKKATASWGSKSTKAYETRYTTKL